MAGPEQERPRKTNPAKPGDAKDARGQKPSRPAASGQPQRSKATPQSREAQGRRARRGDDPTANAALAEALVPVRLIDAGFSPSTSTRPLPQAKRVGPSGSPVASGPISNRPIPVKQVKPGDLPEGYDEEEDPEDLTETVKNSPALLVSVIAHLVVLIVLGLYASTEKKQNEVMIEASQGAEENALLDTDVEMADNPLQDMQDPETVITPQNLPPVDDPFAAPPVADPTKASIISPLGVGTEAALTGDINAPMIGLALKGRSVGSKKLLLGHFGGNKGTEDAVLNGLKWLARQQKADGSWSLIGPYTNGGRVENVASATAMALLAFQGHGDTPTQGQFSGNVKRGWDFLLKLQDADGYFCRDCVSQHRLYSQAQCTIAICELYGMTGDEKWRGPAEKAIKYAIKAQDPRAGGWRYEPGEDSDTSVTGWFVMALQSAKMAKLEVPQQTLDNVMKFLDSVAYDGGRQYHYRSSESTMAVTAEGLLCRQYLGWPQTDMRLIEGTMALTKKPITYAGDRGVQDVYYWYYATQACHHMETPIVNGQKMPIWDEWNNVMKVQVPAHQMNAGPELGSWDPRGDKWGFEGGRLYTTCLSIFMLEVYYRHLPIYSGK